jgi:hypothetical protein
MKYFLIVATLVAVTLTNFNCVALASDVGMPFSIGQPGFYGQLDLGGYPQPRVLYRQPIIIERILMDRPPIYMNVPPGHAKHWGKHCREYNACSERVFFVQDNWYNREYVPRYKKRYGNRDDHGKQGNKDHGHKHGRDN